MSQPNSELSKWKDKYYNALDDLEALELVSQTSNSLFCRALIRLSLAVKGFNQQLDPHLLRLRNQLKQGLANAELKQELESFSEALLRFEDGSAIEPLQDAALLFDFLTNQEQSPQKVSAINLLRGQYDTGKLAGSKELLELVSELYAVETIELDDGGDLVGIAANLDAKFICEQLSQLIQGLDVPDISQARTKKILQALQAEQIEATFQENIDAALSLLQDLKEHNQFEKKEMEVFLAHINQQLAALSKSAKGVVGSTGKIIRKRNNLDQTVSKQMQSLQENSATATKLEPLKSLIKSELDDIEAQIKQHQQEEQQQQASVEKQLAAMTTEMETMKAEALSLKENLKRASAEAMTDALTQLPNRNAYDSHFSAEYARWHRYQTPLSLLVWDIDLFKKINDNYGHKAGDKTLIIIARLLEKYCRETDFVSRFGGEEFTMLLSDTDKKSAWVLAEKVRKIIAKTGFNSAGKAIGITISCGIAELQQGDTQETVFERADKALYQAKKNGRNQCVIA
ncbi:MAG: diguanylate cyclase [Methyloprofundus sp.]|nr:MAG: diguanylate cyclase [Methyloprofundus sp.]